MRKSFVKVVGKTRHNFQVEADSLHELIMEEQKLSFPDVHRCGLCGKDNLRLGAHTAQGKYKYVTIKCRDCKASLNFGQQQEDSDVWYLRTKKDNGGNTVRDENGFPVHDWQQYQANE
jgi:hypothetical protein